MLSTNLSIEDITEQGLSIKNKAKLVGLLIVSVLVIGIVFYMSYRINQSVMTSGFVLGDFKQIEELRVLRLNKAEIFEDKEDNGKQKGIFIFRYSIDIYYNLEDCRFIPTNNNTFILEVSLPTVNGVLESNCKTTLEKDIDEFPGIEIFDWNPKRYHTNELEAMAQKYIEDDIKNNKSKYEELSLQNLKQQLNILFAGFNAIVSDVKFSTGGKS